MALDVGDLSKETFARLYARLPEAGLHRMDAYGVYGCCPRTGTWWAKVARWTGVRGCIRCGVVS